MGYARGLLAVLGVALTMAIASRVHAAGGVDATPDYLDAYRSDCAFGMAHVDMLRRHKVLQVPGYFSDLDPAYFSDQSRWLASIGVEYEKVALQSRQSVAINAPIIAAAIRDSAKPVILITHSKGSVDTLDALRAQKVDGGYVISGKWNFSSGVNLSEWCMLAVMVRGNASESKKVVDYRMCLLQKSQYEIIDDWHVMGMRSTGSMSVVAKDVFVPDYKALSMLDARGGDGFPGAKTNANPLYRVSLQALGGHGIAATAVGNAMAALEHTRALVKERSTNYTASKMRDFQVVQLRVGAAGAKIDAARLMLRNDCFDAMEIARSNIMPDIETKLRFKRNAAYVAQLATEAVDALHTITGATGIYANHPLERIFRDAHALAAHISLNFDAQASSWGLAALGGEVNIPTL